MVYAVPVEHTLGCGRCQCSVHRLEVGHKDGGVGERRRCGRMADHLRPRHVLVQLRRLLTAAAGSSVDSGSVAVDGGSSGNGGAAEQAQAALLGFPDSNRLIRRCRRGYPRRPPAGSVPVHIGEHRMGVRPGQGGGEWDSVQGSGGQRVGTEAERGAVCFSERRL